MSTKRCPACGSENITTCNEIEYFQDSFAGEVEAKIVEDECLVCGAEGDFDSINDAELKGALEIIKKNAAKNIINAFTSHGYNLAGIERALELPQRTLSKWRNDTPPSAAGLTLLKMVSVFPWLIEVAETKFDVKASQNICAHAAVNYLGGILEQVGHSLGAYVNSDTTNIFNFVQVNNFGENTLNGEDVPGQGFVSNKPELISRDM